jgi:hypothetical protein
MYDNLTKINLQKTEALDTMASKLSIAMTKEGISREILGERISNHVARGAIN